jgi:hypothetical protein
MESESNAHSSLNGRRSETTPSNTAVRKSIENRPPFWDYLKGQAIELLKLIINVD